MNRRVAKRITALATILLVAGSVSVAATARFPEGRSKEDAWGPVRFLVGHWKGSTQGKYGTAKIQVTGKLILSGKYLFLRTKSVFKPQDKNPKGETHEDWAIISYDQARGKFVLRQFNVEGFVNRYVLEDISEDGNRLVFLTEAVENGPPGMRARSTYTRNGNDEFVEVFELALQGRDFSACITSKLTRRR